MGRRAKPPRVKRKAKRPLVRKALTKEAARLRDLETRLSESLERENAKDRALAEAVERQTATSEILRVIAASRELQPVLDAIALRAATLCAADIAGVTPVEDGLFKVGGNYGFPEAVARS